MSRKLTLQAGSGGGRTAVLTALAAAGALAVLSLLALAVRPRLAVWMTGETKITAMIVLAILAYMAFRMLYGLLSGVFPGDMKIRTVEWTIDGGVLTLDGKAIPLNTIRQVHCWPNRDALGHNLPGWTVNIEGSGGNELLRSVAAGPAAELSTRQLHALVDALGYADRWPEGD